MNIYLIYSIMDPREQRDLLKGQQDMRLKLLTSIGFGACHR